MRAATYVPAGSPPHPEGTTYPTAPREREREGERERGRERERHTLLCLLNPSDLKDICGELVSSSDKGAVMSQAQLPWGR